MSERKVTKRGDWKKTKRGKTIEKLNNGERRNVLYLYIQRRKNWERGSRGEKEDVPGSGEICFLVNIWTYLENPVDKFYLEKERWRMFPLISFGRNVTQQRFNTHWRGELFTPDCDAPLSHYSITEGHSFTITVALWVSADNTHSGSVTSYWGEQTRMSSIFSCFSAFSFKYVDHKKMVSISTSTTSTSFGNNFQYRTRK